MKVELSSIRLAMTAIGQRICIGVPEKNNIAFKESHDVTSDFLKCIIEWGAGYRRKITSENGKIYEVTVRDITPGGDTPKS